MDLSALIFVALALAWGVYLVPKALKHHEASVRHRSAEQFATRMRVLASHAPLPSRESRTVLAPGRPASGPVVTRKPRSGAASVAAARGADSGADSGPGSDRRPAAGRAARRRRRVLGLLVGALATVGVLCLVGLLPPGWVVLPAGLVVAWLVTCRVAVRAGRRQPTALGAVPQPATAGVAQQEPVAGSVAHQDGAVPHRDPGVSAAVPTAGEEDSAEAETGELPLVEEPGPLAEPTGDHPAAAGTGLWDPQPMTLPTYVSKPAAHARSPQGIDLDATGVWTSGRTEADAALAREAEEAERAAREAEHDRERRTGS